MRLFNLLVLSILIGSVLVPFTTAQNMTFSDLNIVTSQDILIYDSNGTLTGTYNTSSAMIPLPANDFNVIMKPSAIKRFLDPNQALSDGFDWIQTNWISLVAVLAIGAIYFGGRR